MFEVSVETSFVATHAVTMNGIDEDPHSHDWKVVLTVQGDSLDNDGLLVDFLDLEKQLEEAVAPLNDVNLNSCAVLNKQNPSTERIACYIASCINVSPPAQITSVTVTEAPHCKATFKP